MPWKDLAGTKAGDRAYYQRNREHLLKKQAERNKRATEKRRQWFIAYEESLQYINCGRNYLQCLLFIINQASRRVLKLAAAKVEVSLNILLAEIEKMRSVMC